MMDTIGVSHVRGDGIAVCTQDGMLQVRTLREAVWTLKLDDYHFFALSAVMIPELDPDTDVAVACTVNGATVFFDATKQLVQYFFERAVCAFTAGQYGVTPGTNQPCLIYVTFNGTIDLMYGISLQSLGFPRITDDPDIKAHLQHVDEATAARWLGRDVSVLSRDERDRLVIQYLLYGKAAD